jgi:hypothetical protein
VTTILIILLIIILLGGGAATTVTETMAALGSEARSDSWSLSWSCSGFWECYPAASFIRGYKAPFAIAGRRVRLRRLDSVHAASQNKNKS